MELQLSDERKISFLRSKFNDLKGVDFALLVETHLLDQNNHNCEGIKDSEITHNVVHSYRVTQDFALSYLKITLSEKQKIWWMGEFLKCYANQKQKLALSITL